MSAVAPLDAAGTWFDRTTAVHRAGDHHVAELDPSWSSLTGIHGGSMVAMAVRAAQDLEPDRRVRTVATSFLRPGRPGPAELHAETVRRGRSLTSLGIELRQRGRAVLVSRITLVADRPGLPWRRSEPIDVAPLEDCIPLEPPAEAGLVPHFDHATAVLDPAHVPFSRSEDARVAGHVRPLEPRPVDEPWLAMVMDWFPPSPFTRPGPPAGGVSIDYVVHLHATRPPLDDGAWLAGSFRADVSDGGLALEHGRLAGPDGTLLAESFHTRWTG